MNGALEQALFSEQQLGPQEDMSEKSWWNMNEQQSSKLDISVISSGKSAVDAFFNKAYLMDEKNKSLMNLIKEFDDVNDSNTNVKLSFIYAKFK